MDSDSRSPGSGIAEPNPKESRLSHRHALRLASHTWQVDDMHDLSHFIDTRCRRDATCTTPVKALVDQFRSTLPPGQRRAWGRTRIVAELTRDGISVGRDASGVMQFVGLSLKDRALTVRDGHLLADLA